MLFLPGLLLALESSSAGIKINHPIDKGTEAHSPGLREHCQSVNEEYNRCQHKSYPSHFDIMLNNETLKSLFIAQVPSEDTGPTLEHTFRHKLGPHTDRQSLSHT